MALSELTFFLSEVGCLSFMNWDQLPRKHRTCVKVGTDLSPQYPILYACNEMKEGTLPQHVTYLPSALRATTSSSRSVGALYTTHTRVPFSRPIGGKPKWDIGSK